MSWMTELIKDDGPCLRCGEPGKVYELRTKSGWIKRVYCDQHVQSVKKQHNFTIKRLKT